MVYVHRKISTRRAIIASIAIILLMAFFISLPQLSTTFLSSLNITPGPEGIDCSLYSAVANGGIRVYKTEKEITTGKGIPSVIGKVTPGTWIAYTDYAEYPSFPMRIGYRWIRVDPKSPAIEAVIIDKEVNSVTHGVNLQIRIEKPSMEEIRKRPDPLGKSSPTQIEYYSYNTERTESGNTITWKHYEVVVVPVDFTIELAIRPSADLDDGDFRGFDLWFVIDIIAWINAFSQNQYALLREMPPEGVKITSYNFRGGFPIWAWASAWEPWQVYGRDGNPEKAYDLADLTPEERAKIEMHLQVLPSFKGTEVTLYTKPGYIYDRIFASDIVKDPNKLVNFLEQTISTLPDPRFAQTVYFHLTLINYGALKEEWYSWLIFYGHKEFYPVSTLRVRVLYAIYGEWVFQWTKEKAEEYKYEWEDRSSVIVDNPDAWSKFLKSLEGWDKWISNPLSQLWFAFILVMVVVAVVTIFNPGIWMSLLATRRKK